MNFIEEIARIIFGYSEDSPLGSYYKYKFEGILNEIFRRLSAIGYEDCNINNKSTKYAAFKLLSKYWVPNDDSEDNMELNKFFEQGRSWISNYFITFYIVCFQINKCSNVQALSLMEIISISDNVNTLFFALYSITSRFADKLRTMAVENLNRVKAKVSIIPKSFSLI